MTDHQTAQRLLAMENVLILTHRRPDGDTIGCACALCLALRQLGKTAWVLPNEDAHGLFTPYFEGVDNAVTIRQLKPEECKISLRTDGKTLNASAVCAVYGGGGHAAAAGCTIQGTPAQAKAAMLKAIEQVQHG